MTSKERVLASIEHIEPDFIPVCATFVPEISKKLHEKYNPNMDIGLFLGNDMLKIASGLENSFYMSDTPTYIDRYGIEWLNAKNQSGSYTEIINHPLSKLSLSSFKMPKAIDDSKVIENVKNAVSKHGKEKWIVGSCQCTLFEASWYLRGMETFLEDMLLDEDYTNELLDTVMTYPLEMGKIFINEGVDMVWLGDDIATQTNMLMSPSLWRKYLKPRYAVLFSEFKKTNKNIKLCYHSCGNLEAVIPDLIEIGLDVLNPIQPLAMDVAHIKKTYGDKITMYGTLDVQKVMPFGSPNDVKNEVKRLIEICSPNGGFILSPAHHIQADTSLENIEAFYSAAKEFGKYRK